MYYQKIFTAENEEIDPNYRELTDRYLEIDINTIHNDR